MERIKLEFRNLFKEFLASSNAVEIEEDIIKNSDTISEGTRKELMAALSKTQKLEKTYSGIPVPTRVNHKKAIQETLEQNPVKINSKTGKIVEEKEDELGRE